jgi:hypothetical protein
MSGREGLIDTAVKSVTGDTPIVFMENGSCKYMNIGDWIDNQLEENQDAVNHFEERQMEHLYIKNKVFIPTTNEEGAVSWGEVTAITRHDPGTELYEIKTEGGKKVIVTESKSLLIWNQKLGKLEETSTPDINVGDCVPVTMNLLSNNGCYDDNIPESIVVASIDVINEYLNKLRLIDNTFIATSQKEIDIIAMCHTRLGIYGHISNIDNNKYMFSIVKNPEVYNDIVLDKIVEINIIGIEKYPKVYDLTIPSTLNFGLANGLQVRDTSDTGYIQRKLIKGMEDARIMTDYTVRNANGTIIQFLYGEDGFDGAKIEKQKLTSLGKSDKTLYDEYMLKLERSYLKTIYIDTIVKDIIKNKEKVSGKFESHINKIIKDRNYYYEHIFKGSIDDDVYSPINFRRLVENASYQFGSKNSLSDLSPLYVLDKLTYIEENLKITENYKGNELIVVLANLYLSPNLLNKNKINKLAFDYIIATINQQFYSSIAHPGELVGTIAAQSMGEPSKVCVLGTGRCHIGYLITYMEKHCKLGQVYNCLVIV